MHTMLPEGSLDRPRAAPLPGARLALGLLLLINLFNYIDRKVLAAVVSPIKESFFGANGAMGGPATTLTGALVGLVPAAPGLQAGERSDRHPRHGVHGHLHDWRAGFRSTGRAPLALGAGGHRRDSLEPGQRRLGTGDDIHDAPADALLRRHRRGGLRAGRARHHFRLLPGQNPRPGAGVVLHGDPGGQRARLRSRRDRGDSGLGPWGAHNFRRQSGELALGVLSGRGAGDPAGRLEPLHARAAARAGGPRAGRARGRRALARLPAAPAHSLLRVVHAGHGGDDLCHRRHGLLDALLPATPPGHGWIPDHHLRRHRRRRRD